MKKLFYVLLSLSLVLVSSLHQNANAQIVKSITLSKTTLTAPDTAKATLSVDNTVVSVEVTINKTSGTVAGTAKLQGSYDGTNWDDISSLTLADVTLNRKVLSLPIPLAHPIYRVIFITSGTNVTTVGCKQLRRTE